MHFVQTQFTPLKCDNTRVVNSIVTRKFENIVFGLTRKFPMFVMYT